MKKWMAMLAMLLLALTPALAEEVPAVPVEILPQTEGLLYMTEAIDTAKAAIEKLPADCLTRAELVRMSDGSCQWVVTIFDLTNFSDGWCIMVDAGHGGIVVAYETDIGYFDGINGVWQSVKGPEALWSLEDKLLFDNLYAMQPTYGLPMESDMSQTEALLIAMRALGLEGLGDYEIGYGYMMGMGDGDVNGMWEVCFVQNGEMIYKVNLDAVTGEIYLIEPDEEGNG